MAFTQDYLVGLTKQVFMLDYIINGLFPCQSDVTRLIRANKREWKFNDKFEYRMLLSHTNTGGTLNSQVFKENVGLHKPGELEYGIYRASYGTVSDGFDVDMMINLETKEKMGAFENDYTMRMQSLRFNVASLFKNFAIHGQYGVVHQIRGVIGAPGNNVFNPQPNVFVPSNRVPFTIKVPINVFASNFKKGKYLIKTTATDTAITGPWDPANVGEIYLVLDNQPGTLSLMSVGDTPTPWADGQFLEVQGNREIASNSPAFNSSSWTSTFVVSEEIGGPFAGEYNAFTPPAGLSYTSGKNAIVGAMEGLADMFPWYTNPANPSKRLGLDMPYRDQADRSVYSTEQAGGWVTQKSVFQDGYYRADPEDHIIDCILRGAFMTKITVPYADIGVWINPATKQRMGYEAGGDVRVIRDNFLAGPIIYQRGVQSTSYQIGTQTVKEVIEDPNMPTDVVVIGPQKDLSYNCWDNSYMEIDKFIHDTWGKTPPPEPENLQIPDEFLSKLDISNRILFGSPAMSDGGMSAGWSLAGGNRIRHPKNMLPIAMQEMGALFTEYPYCYTIVKLVEPETEFSGGS